MLGPGASLTRNAFDLLQITECVDALLPSDRQPNMFWYIPLLLTFCTHFHFPTRATREIK